MRKIISSQHYLDDAIVAAKRAQRDYVVCISPEFEFEGVQACVILDGHHSLAAAITDGVTPEFVVATKLTHDVVALLERDVELFLEATWLDGDYYDAINGGDVW